MNMRNILSNEEKILLIDGYCQKNRYNKNYISVDLCAIILEFFSNILIYDFIIIFEKYKNEDDHVNELLCYDLKLKTKLIKNNELWKWHYCSYCLHETKNDYFIYRIGGENNETIPNIRY